MSQQRSLEQKRAAAAWIDVSAVKSQLYEAKYRTLVKGAMADIQTNGLGQTLAFWAAKKEDHHKTLLKHISVWVKSQLRIVSPNDLLPWVIQDATIDSYRRATSEAMAFLSWLKRFAEAELKDKQ
jgi:CRISPR-associated protein Cmr5